MTWCARIRFRLPERVVIRSSERELALVGRAGEDVRLLAAEPNKALGDARNVALVCGGYTGESDARAAGIRWRTILETAFARANLPADFGDRAATGVVTNVGPKMLEAEHGVRVLNDVHGLMVFECEPWPGFAKGEVNMVVGRAPARLTALIAAAARTELVVDERRSVSFGLFSASFAVSDASSDARFA